MNWYQRLTDSRRNRRRRNVLNVVVYDRTQTSHRRRAGTEPKRRPGWIARLNPVSLTFWWTVGGRMFRLFGRADVVVSAASWAEAWGRIETEVARVDPAARIGSLQVWGHGGDGTMWLAGDAFDWACTDPDLDRPAAVEAIRRRMDPAGGLVWFRGCNTFRGRLGQAFARQTAAAFGVPVAGHTFIIGLYHSGTHVLHPGAAPHWDEAEGYDPERRRSPWSKRGRPRTISMLRFHPPE